MRKTLIAAITAVAFVATLAGPADAAGHDPTPSRQAGNWLYGQLNAKHLMHNGQYHFDDYGLTADTGLGLAAIGRNGQARTIARALAPKAATAWYTSTYEGVTTTYAGSVAKAAVLAQATGLAATSYGGVNLIALLESEVAQAAPIAGRLEDNVEPSSPPDADYANTLGQALAARALHQAGSSQAASATSFLLTQQCSTGYFRLDFTKDKTSPDQSCDHGDGTADTDATSYAVIQLAAMALKSNAVRTAIAHARSWLRSKQRPGGAWGGGASTTGSNANSTGLAAWALGNSAASRHAAVWLRKQQARDARGCHTRLSSSRGAIAYDNTVRRAGHQDGITATTRDQWRRTTTQAAMALALLPRAGKALSVTSASHVRPGHRIAVHVRHAAPYSNICVRVGTSHRTASVGARGRADVWLRAPYGKHHRVVRATDSDGRSDVRRIMVRR